jgi:hypothetical protein
MSTLSIEIPLGANVRVKRLDGTVDSYKFRGTDEAGPIFEDADGHRHTELGLCDGIAVDLPDGLPLVLRK